MTVSHRAAKVNQMKVVRMSCCCKLSELLPLVLQLHEQARATYAAHHPPTRSEAA